MNKDKDNILKLIDKLPEVYQDIKFNGELLAKGVRDCQDHWTTIRERIGSHDVVLDLGSSVGYYSHKIAQEFPDSLVISFESDPIMCQIQREIYKAEGIYNVVVCNHRLSADDLRLWVKYVDCFDTTLALAVLHHYPEDEVSSVFNNLRVLSGQIIGEVPASEEVEACGAGAKTEALKIAEDQQRIGSFSSHLGDYKRNLWVTKHAQIDRLGLDAFYGVAHMDRHKFDLTWDKEWRINQKRIIPGVNVWNLLHYNIVYPLEHWWIKQAQKAYDSLRFKSDVRPWNLLVTSRGLLPIDYMTKFPLRDPAEFKRADIIKLANTFIKMKPVWR